MHINSLRIREYDCERIMHVLDDVNLQSLNVTKLVHVAEQMKADMVSPKVLGATQNGCTIPMQYSSSTHET